MIADLFDVFYRSVYFFFADPTIFYVFVVIVSVCLITSLTNKSI
jgi:low affinity Fe/Cu permease